MSINYNEEYMNTKCLQNIFVRTLHSLENKKFPEVPAKAAMAETALFD